MVRPRMKLFYLTLVVLVMTCTVRSYIYNPKDSFPITRNVRGIHHYVGCRLVYQPIVISHSKCPYPRRLLLYGCAGYCGSDSNLAYRNPWRVYQLDRKCYTCDADRHRMRKFAIQVCPGARVEIPIPASCVCQRCSLDYVG